MEGHAPTAATLSAERLRDRLARIWSLANEIYAQRPDLQAAFADVRSEDFWIWMDVAGRGEYPALRDLLVPVPPPRVREFVGSASEAEFLGTGVSIYRLLTEIAQEVGRPLPSLGAILDFGCGPGRALRYFLRYAQTVACTGIDIHAHAIGWCQIHFPFGDFRVNCDIPPTEFAPATFDLIYAISVFSHLAEANHLAWLMELRRLAKREGTLVVTLHGEHALRRALSEEAIFRFLRITEADLASARQQLAARHYAFVRQPEGHLNRDLYGVTFIGRQYVLSRWSEVFEIVSYREGALDSWQDAVVLQPRP
jgi:SAM-dependent methyltransferase